MRLPPYVLSPLLCLPLALSAIGCGADDTNDGDGGIDDPTWTIVKSDAERDPTPSLTAAETAALAADQQALALDLYHVLREDQFAGQGFAVSSYSVATAFGMLYGGTVGQAREEMESTLHFSLGDERQHVAHNWLDQQLSSRNLAGDENHDPVVLEVANGVWALEDLRNGFNPSFLDLLAVHYGAGVYLADFPGNAEGEVKKINQWVSNRTRGLIPQLFGPGIINELTTMVLVNALYLKAPWLDPFNENATSKAPFTRLDGSTFDADLMHHPLLVGSYGSGEGYAALAIPLRGYGLEVVFVVPDEFAAFEAALDQPGLDALLADMTGGAVNTYIPRFELETSVSLASVLRDDLGMPSPFVDSSSFDDIVPGLGVITDVIHKTVIKVDEKGTEAAAATGIVLGDDGGGYDEPIATFRADKPFLLMIRDRPTQSVLFFGRVLEP